MKLKFLQKIKTSCILEKEYGEGFRKWSDGKEFERVGYFIGYRTLSNVKFSYKHRNIEWMDEVDLDYEITDYIRVALVVFNDKENPVYVPLTAITDIQQPY